MERNILFVVQITNVNSNDQTISLVHYQPTRVQSFLLQLKQPAVLEKANQVILMASILCEAGRLRLDINTSTPPYFIYLNSICGKLGKTCDIIARQLRVWQTEIGLSVCSVQCEKPERLSERGRNGKKPNRHEFMFILSQVQFAKFSTYGSGPWRRSSTITR